MSEDKTSETAAENEGQQALRRAIQQALSFSSGSYEETAAAVTRVRHIVHEELARAIAPVLTQRLREMDHDDADSRRKLTAWANEQARNWGLAFRCPKTHVASLLLADARDGHATNARFRLGHRDAAGRSHRTMSSTTLPDLELMEDAPRREAFARRPDSSNQHRTR